MNSLRVTKFGAFHIQLVFNLTTDVLSLNGKSNFVQCVVFQFPTVSTVNHVLLVLPFSQGPVSLKRLGVTSAVNVVCHVWGSQTFVKQGPGWLLLFLDSWQLNWSLVRLPSSCTGPPPPRVTAAVPANCPLFLQATPSAISPDTTTRRATELHRLSTFNETGLQLHSKFRLSTKRTPNSAQIPTFNEGGPLTVLSFHTETSPLGVLEWNAIQIFGPPKIGLLVF